MSFNNDEDGDGLAALFGGITPQDEPKAAPGPRRAGGGVPQTADPTPYDLPAPEDPPQYHQPPYPQPQASPPPTYQAPAPSDPPAYQPPAYQPPAYQQPAYQPPAYEPPAYEPASPPPASAAPAYPPPASEPFPAQPGYGSPAESPRYPGLEPSGAGSTSYPGLAAADPLAPAGYPAPPEAAPAAAPSYPGLEPQAPPAYVPPSYELPSPFSEAPASRPPEALTEPPGYQGYEVPAAVPVPVSEPPRYEAPSGAPTYEAPSYEPPAAMAADPGAYVPPLETPPVSPEPAGASAADALGSAHADVPARVAPAGSGALLVAGPLLPSVDEAATPEDLERATAAERVGLVASLLTGPIGLIVAIVLAVRGGNRRGWLIGISRISLVLGVLSTAIFSVVGVILWNIRVDQMQHDELAAASAEFCAAAAADPAMVSAPLLGWPAPASTVPESLDLMVVWTSRWTDLAATSPEELRTGLELMARKGQEIIDSITVSRTIDTEANEELIVANEPQSGVAEWHAEYCVTTP